MVIALLAAGVAAWIASGLGGEPQVVTQIQNQVIENTVRIPTVKVLVAKEGIPVGARLNNEVVSEFILRGRGVACFAFGCVKDIVIRK